MIETIGWAIGVPTALLGIAGGILGLPSKLREYQRVRRPHGNKGTGWLVLSRRNTPTAVDVTFLVFDDLIHALASLMKVEGANVNSIRSLGQYYEVNIAYPPESSLHYRVIDKPQE